MRLRIGSLWRRGTPQVRMGAHWKPIVDRWVKTNNLWKRTSTPAPNYSGIVNMEARSNAYWTLFYAFSSDHVTVGNDVGETTTRQTVDGVNIAAIALTVRQVYSTVSQHRTAEIVLDGDQLGRNIPVAYFNGIPAFFTHEAFTGGDTIFFFTANQDIYPTPDMEVTF